MAQGEYEEQPEAPDLGASVQLEPDYTTVGPGGADPLDAGSVPPDRPYELDDDAVLARGMQEDVTLDDRLAQERPDLGVDTRTATEDGDRAGRLEATADAPDTWGAQSLDAVDVGISGGAATAEEAAVHVLPAEEMGEAPGTVVEDLDDEDLPDDALGIDDRAPEDLDVRPEEDVRAGHTATDDDLDPEIDQGSTNA